MYRITPGADWTGPWITCPPANISNPHFNTRPFRRIIERHLSAPCKHHAFVRKQSTRRLRHRSFPTSVISLPQTCFASPRRPDQQGGRRRRPRRRHVQCSSAPTQGRSTCEVDHCFELPSRIQMAKYKHLGSISGVRCYLQPGLSGLQDEHYKDGRRPPSFQDCLHDHQLGHPNRAIPRNFMVARE